MRKELCLKNSRLIPTEDVFIKDKKFNLEVYTKIQLESNWSDIDAHRYIDVDKIFYKYFANDIGITRESFKKGLEYLIDLGILKEHSYNGIDYYKIKNRYNKILKFEESFLRALIGLKTKNLLKVYIVYYKYSFMYGKCLLKQEKVLESIGLSGKSESNKDMLRQINNKLEQLGLITIERNIIKSKNHVTTILSIEAKVYYETEFFMDIQTNH